MDASFQFAGVAETKAGLAELKTSFANKLVRKALRIGAKILQKALIANAPIRTGLTKSAIKVRAAKRKRGRIGMLVSVNKDSFPEAFYAGFVNWGHLTGKRGSQNRKKIEGTHWMEKAWEQATDDATNETREALAEGLAEFKKTSKANGEEG